MPRNYALMVSIVIVAVVAAYYIKSFYIHPAGEVPFIGSDEVVWLDSAKAVLWGFENPFFMNEGYIFHDPFPGSPYIMAFIGAVFYVTSVDPALVLIITKLVFLFLLLVTSYKIAAHFFPTRFEMTSAFLLYITLGGIGGISYLIYLAVAGSVPPQYQGAMLFTGIAKPDSAIYHIASLFFGHSFLLMLLKGRNPYFAGLLLGLSALVYPIFGAAFFAAAVIYGIVFRKADCVKMLIVASLAALPWAISYMQYPDIIQRLSEQKNYINPMALAVQGFFVLLFSAAYAAKFRSVKDRKWLFISAFALFTFVLGLLPLQINPLTNPQRLIWVMFLPLSIVAVKGMSLIGVPRKAIAAMLVISSVTLFAGNAVIIAAPFYHISDDEYEAVKFLKGYEFGNVLTTEKLGDFIPYQSEMRSHHTLFYSDSPFFEEYRAMRAGDERLFADIVKKYEIKYVVSPVGDVLGLMAESSGAELIGDTGEFRIFVTSP